MRKDLIQKDACVFTGYSIEELSSLHLTILDHERETRSGVEQFYDFIKSNFQMLLTPQYELSNSYASTYHII